MELPLNRIKRFSPHTTPPQNIYIELDCYVQQPMTSDPLTSGPCIEEASVVLCARACRTGHSAGHSKK